MRDRQVLVCLRNERIKATAWVRGAIAAIEFAPLISAKEIAEANWLLFGRLSGNLPRPFVPLFFASRSPFWHS